MSAYTDTAAAIQRAREARDAARDDLYALQLRRLTLARAIQGDGVRDPAIDSAVRPLRVEIAAAAARQAQIAKRLDSLKSLPADLETLRQRIDGAPKHSAALAHAVSTLGDQLRKLANDTAPAERTRVQEALRTAQTNRAAFETRAQQDRDALAAKEKLGAEATALRRESTALKARVTELHAEIDAANVRGQHTDLGAQSKQNASALGDQRRVVGLRERDVKTAINELYDGRTPQDLIAEWDDGVPILLLPVRVETRWRVVAPGAAGATSQLCVRVYPDDVAVTTHERVLTGTEIDRGQAYWIAVRAANGDTNAEGSAWSTLAARFGANRAAWVALQTKPVNWPAALADSALALQFPVSPVTKPDAWTVAPHSRVLPDRFVLLAWRGDTLRVTEVGQPIDDVVVLGPAPADDPGGDSSINRDEVDQTLAFGEAFAWVRDFDRAVTSGMGFRVDVSAEDAALGFDRLLVLGLKLSADAPAGQTLVEQLIDDHHYSREGFELLRQGTPTNNTDGGTSGYSRGAADETSVAASGPPQFTPVDDRSAASDGQRLADFLGLWYSPVLFASGADHADYAEAVAMNRALYAGTLGYYLDHVLNEVVDDAWLGTLRRHFTDQVTGRGPIAAIRVGSQPYGILPTSALLRWQPSVVTGGDNRGGAPGAARDPFERTLLSVLQRFDLTWTSVASQLVQVGSGGDASANLLDILGLQPTSAEFYQRVGYSYDYLKNLEAFAWGGSDYADVLKMMMESMGSRILLAQLGYHPQRSDGTPKTYPLLLQLIWRHYQTALDPRQLIDGQPFSESALIKPYDAASGRTYLDWLLVNAANAPALQAQDFGSAPAPNAMLYLMLHFALVMEAARGIRGWLAAREVSGDELVRSRKFLNIGAQPSPSIWEVFQAPANRIVSGDPSNQSLLQVCTRASGGR